MKLPGAGAQNLDLVWKLPLGFVGGGFCFVLSLGVPCDSESVSVPLFQGKV